MTAKHIIQLNICLLIGLLPSLASKAQEMELVDVVVLDDDEIEIEIEADSTATDFFVSVPISVLPTIDIMTRLDMLDYFHAGSDKASTNLFGGDCKVTFLSKDKISVSTSEVSDYTIDLLPASDKKIDKIVMLTRSLKTPSIYSSVKFYDAHWQEIKENLLPMPTLSDWILPTAKDKRLDIENAVPFVMSTITYDAATQTATLTNNVGEYVAQESKELVESSLAKSIKYHWNGKKFIREK